MNTFAEYIAARTEWRAEYKTLSAEIRKTKRFIAETFRNGGIPGSAQYSTLPNLRESATEMMVERMIMKERGKELWLAAKEKVAE